MKTVSDIRNTFVDYYSRHGHRHVESGPLIPRNDPTLMFTSAGMVQFKNVFTGIEKREYSRAVTSQKCLRAGGKHNDLDNVGYTARHHTFFEMLGNFSFGEYFKDVAIELAWNLVHKEFALSRDRLWVTVYHTDDVAAELWKKIAGLPDERIIRIPTSDNFWAMGDTGPCGPCSEIFYDHGPKVQGGPPGSPEEDGDRYIEIYNLVFMQYESLDDGRRIDLPKPSIDTGMGLERTAALLQGKHNNYDIDLMQSIIQKVAEIVKVSPDGVQKASHRVIADHLRASAFLIAEGLLPSNEGRGYVLRRIMRRAMRHAQLLGAREPLMHQLTPTLIREMGTTYPELVSAQNLIQETLLIEETRFGRTLERGLGLLQQATSNLSEGESLSGEVAFNLYDTYGFPLDLTQDALKSKKIGVDVDGFNKQMEKSRAEARASWSGSGEAATEPVWFTMQEKLGATEFLGYTTDKVEAMVTALIKDGAACEKLRSGESGWVLVNQTPFYAESGGQVGDLGVMLGKDVQAVVHDAQKKLGSLFAHKVSVVKGTLATGDALILEIDRERRAKIRRNHSATHLLHAALRKVLGSHVTQKGSLVDPDRLRFDFAHNKPMSKDDIIAVEQLANDIILQDSEVQTKIMGQQEAINSGAMALFGEKYGDEVRVVTMGRDIETPDKVYSRELCGGTHVSRTGEIGLLNLRSESAVAAGVRRIEAVTGNLARATLRQSEDQLTQMADMLNCPPSDALNRLKSLLEERKSLDSALKDARKKLAMGGTGDEQGAKEVNGIKFMARMANGISGKDLKALADQGKKMLGSGVVALISVDETGKASVVVGVTQDITDRINAVTLVQKAAEVLGGRGGGGRPDMAQAGGPEGEKAAAAFDAIESLIAK